ncbi:hypothetical protein [Conexibacter sp. CPCC 206217]|uniref:hypothetical protein n=1 Tax=Conexibacter sp. CPCC 206217 TaxID=3064574 RepID=UPI002721C16C|nr:hypothetical protein [Conexibacter sp. CPCC 206217]MDO8210461.1 hypothetical protein [Conexibacter sp. CPCC 206217]
MLVVLAAAAVSLPPAPSARADETEVEYCDEYDMRLRIEVPPFVHAGEPFALRVTDGLKYAIYDTAVDVFATLDGVRTAVPVTPDGDSSVTLRVPSRPGTFTFDLDWRQLQHWKGSDQEAVCIAGLTTRMVALGRDKKIGDLDAARIAGTYLYRLEPTGFPRGRKASQQRIRIAPRCAVGACDLRFAGVPIPKLGYGHYARADRGFASCTTSTGRVVARAWRTRTSIDFTVAADRWDRNGQLIATRFSGEYLLEGWSTGKSRDPNCRGWVYQAWRVTGRRL